MNEEDHKPAMIRVFIAAPLTDEVVQQLKKTIIPLKKSLKGKDIRWVPWDNYHITLVFLGSVPELDISLIETAMKEAVFEIAPFPVKIGPVDLFPNRKKARLMAAEVLAGDSLTKLQELVSASLVKAGYKIETRKFRPHITVARLKEPVRLRRCSEKDALPVINLIDMIHLYKSDTQPTGVVYSILRSSVLIED